AEDAEDELEAKDADDELEVEEAGVELKAEGADVELEAEEPDGVPKAVIGAGSQRPFAIRDFPIGVYETGESSTARDPQFVGGLAPWALRRDLEALRRHERIREAESETGDGEIEDKAERRLSESIRWNKRFYLEMVRKGAVPKPPSDDEGSERPRKTSRKSDGDEGPSDPRGSPKDESSDFDSKPEAKEANDEPEAEDADDELEVEEAGVEPEAEGADVELEAEEPDGVSEAAIGAGSQRRFSIRDFLMGVYETGESSTTRDPQFVGGLAPWALRRDFEALRRHERIREAESETSRTKVALLGSEAKIRKMEREILHHDLSSVEETL
nr:hypothetical protein [Tanacetum cinerariifolium]